VTPGSIADAIIPAGRGWDGVDLVASELALADRDYDQGVGRESRLRAAIRRTHRLRRSSHRLPTIPGQLTINALTTADSPYS
jgi:hypothetical protein